MRAKTEAILWGIGVLSLVGGLTLSQMQTSWASVVSQDGTDVCMRTLNAKWQQGYDAATSRYESDIDHDVSEEKASARLRGTLERLQIQLDQGLAVCRG